MLRLSRAQVINDLERIVYNPGPARGQRRWTAKGAECSIDRHSYSGQAYGFHVDILRICVHAAPRTTWELLLISEFWQRGGGEAMHTTKWLKQIAGKPNDVLRWISANRD